ncbi:MAG: hypothetical protein AAGI89_06535 [Pseudomonadota bacterium]
MDSSKPTIGFGSLVEDIFGLNIRGLITIRDSVVSPQRVAEAARDKDWVGRYTPSIRLVFFLLTLTGVLRFLWAPEDGDLTADLIASFQDRALEGRDAVQAADQFWAIHGALFPFLAVALVILAASFVRVWGAGTSLALRVRLHMMVLIPSCAFSVLAISAFALYDRSWQHGFIVITAVSLSAAMLIDFVVATRTVAATSTIGKVVKAFLFASVNQVMMMLAATIAASVAVTIAMQSQ